MLHTRCVARAERAGVNVLRHSAQRRQAAMPKRRAMCSTGLLPGVQVDHDPAARRPGSGGDVDHDPAANWITPRAPLKAVAVSDGFA